MKKDIYTWLHERCVKAFGDTDDLEPVISEFLESVKNSPPGSRSEFWKRFEEFVECARKENSKEWMGLFIQVHHGRHQGLGEVWEVETSPPFPEVDVSASYKGKPLPQEFLKIGGEARTIQGGDPPICPECDKDMALLVQINSVNKKIEGAPELEAFQFMDAGNLYVYLCQDCTTCETKIDCY